MCMAQVFKEADKGELSQALLHTNCAAMLDMAGLEVLQLLTSPSQRLPDLSTIARWPHASLHACCVGL